MTTNAAHTQELCRKDTRCSNCAKCKTGADTARISLKPYKPVLLTIGYTRHKYGQIAGLFLLLTCSLMQGQGVAAEQTSFGYLKVFSATQESQWGEGSYYYPHSSYLIYNSHGQVVRRVDNHDSSIDEAPQTVELPTGTYTVQAQSDKNGYVKVPVSIKPGQTMSLHLESGR